MGGKTRFVAILILVVGSTAVLGLENAPPPPSGSECLPLDGYKHRLARFDAKMSELERVMPFMMTDGNPEWRQLVKMRTLLGHLFGMPENPEWVRNQAAALNAIKIFTKRGEGWRRIPSEIDEGEASVFDSLFSTLFGGGSAAIYEHRPLRKKNTPLSFARL